MPTAEKVKQVEQIRERYEKASGVLFTEYRGLSVPALQQLRNDLRDSNAEISVVKNTLFKLAAGDDAENFTEEMTSGPTAVTYIYEDEAAAAKALFDFADKNKNLVIKGGFIDGKVYDGDQIEALSKLPPKDVLIAQVIGTIAAPLSNLVGVVEAIYAEPIRTISAVADKVAEGGGPVEASEEPAEEPVAEATEAPAEEAKAEEAAATEAPAEEAPAEEAKAEESEAPAEETKEESSEESTEEAPTEDKTEEETTE